jgi:signal transduction histidine kinase
MLRAQVTGATLHGEDEWFIRRDATTFPIAWWSAPIDLPSGRGAVVAFTDVTERLAAERAIRERDAAEAAQRRIVAAVHAARRDIARDLHDGAQQRLISLLISAQLAREEAERAGTPESLELLDETIGHAHAAIRDLRELAAGVHPAVLSHRGLVAALDELVARLPLDVTLDADAPEQRLPDALEATAYFLVAEALTNVIKHAGTTAVRVTVRVAADELVIRIDDDGAGGARMDVGSGLAGLADRVGAMGGELVLESPLEKGTTVEVRLPTA